MPLTDRERALAECIIDAENAERERCARIAESFYRDYPADVRHMAKRIAEVIRRRPRYASDPDGPGLSPLSEKHRARLAELDRNAPAPTDGEEP